MESIWICILIVCVLFELMTLNLYTLCAAAGAALAWSAAAFELPFWASSLSFLLLTIMLIAFARPALVNWLLPPKITYRQNSYETSGQIKDE